MATEVDFEWANQEARDRDKLSRCLEGKSGNIYVAAQAKINKLKEIVRELRESNHQHSYCRNIAGECGHVDTRCNACRKADEVLHGL